MNRPVYFEIPATNPEQVADFYCAVFGWIKGTVPAIDNYYTLTTGAYTEYGMNGGVMGKYMKCTTNHVAVDDLDVYIKKVKDLGGKVTMDKMHIDKAGWFVWCKDIDDNDFVLAQHDKEYESNWGSKLPDNEGLNRPVHFEIPASNTDRLAQFYTDLFGWQAQRWEGPFDYILMNTGSAEEAGVNGAIQPKGDNGCTVNTIAVKDIDVTIQKVVEQGGNTVGEKNYIPKIGYMIYCQDPDGNLFSILQPDMLNERNQM